MINISNKEFAEIVEHFQKACAKVKLEPTKRQASKYRMHKGKAYKEGRE
jgi:hypothetical protein